jgi:hypothetical protein
LQKILKKFLRNLGGPFLTFFAHLFKLVIKVNKKSFPRKNQSSTARRVSKMAFDSTAH